MKSKKKSSRRPAATPPPVENITPSTETPTMPAGRGERGRRVQTAPTPQKPAGDAATATQPASRTKITWHTERRKLADLKRWENNPRKILEKPLNDLKKSLGKFGLAEPLVCNPDGGLIGGHARLEALLSSGETEADCMVCDRQLTDKERDELGIRLNKNQAGEFDFDILANQFELPDLVEWGFSMEDLGAPPDFQPVSEDEQGRLDQKKPVVCPKCGHEFTT